MSEEADKNTPASRMHLGLQLDGLRVRYAESRGSAYAAGLFAGDEIIAVNGLRADAATIERMITQAKGSTLHIHYFREHLLRSAEIEVPVNPLPQPGTLNQKPDRIRPGMDQIVQSTGLRPCAASHVLAAPK